MYDLLLSNKKCYWTMKKRALHCLVAATEDDDDDDNDDDDDDDNNACDDRRDAFVAPNHRSPREHSDAYDEDHRHRVSSSDVTTSSGWPRRMASLAPTDADDEIRDHRPRSLR